MRENISQLWALLSALSNTFLNIARHLLFQVTWLPLWCHFILLTFRLSFHNIPDFNQLECSMNHCKLFIAEATGPLDTDDSLPANSLCNSCLLKWNQLDIIVHLQSKYSSAGGTSGLMSNHVILARMFSYTVFGLSVALSSPGARAERRMHSSVCWTSFPQGL